MQDNELATEKYKKKMSNNLEQKEISTVIKSNEIIEARYRLTLIEQKLVLLMVSLIKEGEEDFRYFKIGIKEAIRKINIRDKNPEETIKKSIMNLMTRPVIIPKKDEGVLIATWAASTEYSQKDKTIEFEFSEKLKPYLLQLRNSSGRGYVAYDLDNAAKFTSTYTIRIYEMLKQYEKLRKRVFTIHDIKSILGIKEKQYPLIANLKQRIFEKSVQEINEKTDLFVGYKIEKNLQKEKIITFTIMKKTELQSGEELSNKEYKRPGSSLSYKNFLSLFERIIKETDAVPVNEAIIKKIYETNWNYLNERIKEQVMTTDITFDEYISEKINHTIEESRKKKISSPAGYLIQAIKENFGGISNFISKREKEKRNRIDKEKMIVEEEINKLQASFNNIVYDLCRQIVIDNPGIIKECYEEIDNGKKGYLEKYIKQHGSEMDAYNNSLFFQARINDIINSKNNDSITEITSQQQQKIELLKRKLKEIENG